MDAIQFFILLLVIPLLSATAAGEETLPRVLILGDSVYQQSASEAAKTLKSKVKVVYATIKPASHGADPFFFDRKSLHPPIVRSIVTQLNLPLQPQFEKD